MIKKYNLDRKEIVDLILKGPKTNMNYFYYKGFSVLNSLPGDIQDKKYYYTRELFNGKKMFTITDIVLYLSCKKIDDFDEEEFRFKQNKFDEIMSGYESLDLKDKPVDKQYTIEELINIFNYYY